MVAIENGINYRQHQFPQGVVEVKVLGKRLQEARIKQGYTQPSFAEALGKWLRDHMEPDDDKKYDITRQQVGEWENNKKVPNAFYLRGMGELLKTPTDYLTGATNDPNSRLEEEGSTPEEKEFQRVMRRVERSLRDHTYLSFGVNPPPPELPANVESKDEKD